MPRFYCNLPLAAGRTLELPDETARHAVGALRLRHGETVTLFNGDGAEYAGVLEHAVRNTNARANASVRLESRSEPKRESALRVTLAQGISSGERMDLTIQKAVELGIASIQPLMMRRTVVRLTGDKLVRRRAHWQSVAISACEQCGRNLIPDVGEISDFSSWIQSPQQSPPQPPPHPAPISLKLLLDPEAPRSLRDLAAPSGPVILLAGPEGGFDPMERAMAQAAGFIGIHLGPRILRTETAALAALSAMQALWGDFV